MAKRQTINELANKIERSLPQISIIAANGEVLANNTALGDIGRRIFNEGRRTDGSNIGDYKLGPYRNRRITEGRQINFKDYQFKGDLFNALQVGLLNGRPAVGLISQKEADISGYLEEKDGLVFQASDEERKIALETARNYTFDEMKKLIRSWS